MHERVELVESQAAMAAEDREARVAQRPAFDQGCLVVEWW
jgi:hypothetical protein